MADLSGGEQRRLQLLRLLLAEPNVLLLDEPTNDLDTDTLAALEDLLDSWPGTLVVVSHDRYLIERVCDSTVALLGDGSLAALPGGVDQYLALRRGMEQPRLTAPGPTGTGTDAGTAKGRVDPRVARKEITRLERRIAKLDAREAAIHVEMAAHATDYARVSALDAERQQLLSDKDAAETAWLELSG